MCFLVAMIAVGVYANQCPTSNAAESAGSPVTLKQRVEALETRVNQLQHLVSVLQAEQLRDVLPIQNAAIVGNWVAQTDGHQTITLSMHSNGTCDITVYGKAIGNAHGTGTWKLDGLKVIFSYQYDGQDDLSRIKLPLDVISMDSMAFAGVIYRRTAASGSTTVTQAK